MLNRMVTRVVNLRRERYDVYIGRAGKGQDGYFGNPFTLQKHGPEALTLFLRYFLERLDREQEFFDRVSALQGKTLGCFCKPGPCHGDVIAQWLDGCSRESDGCMIPGPHALCGQADSWPVSASLRSRGAGEE